MVHGIEGTAERPHELRPVTAGDLGGSEKLYGPDHSIVAHCASLHHYILAEHIGILQFQHLVEAVLHH